MSTSGRDFRYYVTLKGEEHVVDLRENGAGFDVTLDGRQVPSDLTLLDEPSLYSLLMSGHSRELVLEREGDRSFVSLDGERIEVRVQDEVSRALSAFSGPKVAGPAEVQAPMPGIVISVPVSVGDEITAGQAVVVVEAMKMQNELCAEADGIVERVAVGPGDTVAGGDVLVVLKPKETA